MVRYLITLNSLDWTVLKFSSKNGKGDGVIYAPPHEILSALQYTNSPSRECVTAMS